MTKTRDGYSVAPNRSTRMPGDRGADVDQHVGRGLGERRRAAHEAVVTGSVQAGNVAGHQPTGRTSARRSLPAERQGRSRGGELVGVRQFGARTGRYREPQQFGPADHPRVPQHRDERHHPRPAAHTERRSHAVPREPAADRTAHLDLVTGLGDVGEIAGHLTVGAGAAPTTRSFGSAGEDASV